MGLRLAYSGGEPRSWNRRDRTFRHPGFFFCGGGEGACTCNGRDAESVSRSPRKNQTKGVGLLESNLIIFQEPCQPQAAVPKVA